jgi:hypothetical protein
MPSILGSICNSCICGGGNSKDEDEANKTFMDLKSKITENRVKIDLIEVRLQRLEEKINSDIKRLEDKMEIKLDYLTNKIDMILLSIQQYRK